MPEFPGESIQKTTKKIRAHLANGHKVQVLKASLQQQYHNLYTICGAFFMHP